MALYGTDLAALALSTELAQNTASQALPLAFWNQQLETDNLYF